MNLQRIKAGSVQAAAGTVGITVLSLYERAVLNGGLDFSISRQRFTALVSGDIDEISDWRSVFFSFDELMAYYCSSVSFDKVDSFLIAACLIYCELSESMGSGDFEITKSKLRYFDKGQLDIVWSLANECGQTPIDTASTPPPSK